MYHCEKDGIFQRKVLTFTSLATLALKGKTHFLITLCLMTAVSFPPKKRIENDSLRASPCHANM